MKIAIHNGGGSFTSRWIKYCKAQGVDYKLVNAYDFDIMKQLDDCDAFMWHCSHINYKDALFAKQLLYSVEASGKKVFPNPQSVWHFDDKVGQKYLLEAIGAPLVSSYIFYSRKDALNWIGSTSFPKVFKLRGGAGSQNVFLVKSKSQAKKLINRAFGKGFAQYEGVSNLKERWRKYRLGKTDIKDVMKGVVRLLLKPEYARMHGTEKGYVYFQEFIPNNYFDLRIIVVGDKAFGIKRLCRENDFRASGSGSILYEKNELDERCVQIAFDLSHRLGFQSMGYDFVFDESYKPLIVEMCFGYIASCYDKCSGYWTEDMMWHEGDNFDFCGWMVENLISE